MSGKDLETIVNDAVKAAFGSGAIHPDDLPKEDPSYVFDEAREEDRAMEEARDVVESSGIPVSGEESAPTEEESRAAADKIFDARDLFGILTSVVNARKAADGDYHPHAEFFGAMMPGYSNAKDIAQRHLETTFKDDPRFSPDINPYTADLGHLDDLHSAIKNDPELEEHPESAQRKQEMEEEHAASRGMSMEDYESMKGIIMNEKELKEVIVKSVMDVLKGDYNLPPGVTTADINAGEEMMTAHHLDDATGRISKVSVPASTRVDTAGEGEGGHFSTYEGAVEHLHKEGGLLPQGERAEDYREIVEARQEHPLPEAPKADDGDVKTSMYPEKMASLAADYMNVRGYDETAINKRARIVEQAMKSCNVTADQFRIYANKTIK